MNDTTQMTPEEAKASLGIATYLQDQMMPQAPQEQEMGQEEGQEMEQPEDTITPRIDELDAKFSEFQKEIKSMIKDEIGGLTKEIKDALDDGKED